MKLYLKTTSILCQVYFFRLSPQFVWCCKYAAAGFQANCQSHAQNALRRHNCSQLSLDEAAVAPPWNPAFTPHPLATPLATRPWMGASALSAMTAIALTARQNGTRTHMRTETELPRHLKCSLYLVYRTMTDGMLPHSESKLYLKVTSFWKQLWT